MPNRSAAEVDDRIFSTSVSCDYTASLPPNIPLGVDSLGEIDQAVGFEETYQAARKVTLETFATHDSASVQVRLTYTWLLLLLLTDRLPTGYSLPCSPVHPQGRTADQGRLVLLAQRPLHVRRPSPSSPHPLALDADVLFQSALRQARQPQRLWTRERKRSRRRGRGL